MTLMIRMVVFFLFFPAMCSETNQERASQRCDHQREQTRAERGDRRDIVLRVALV